MKLFTKPYWIFLTVTLPQSLILLYFFGIYGIISSQLEPEHLDYWFLYGSILGLLIVLITAYGLFLQIRLRPIPWPYALLILTGYMVFLVAYLEGASHLLPFTIPPWMVSDLETFTLPFSLMMPVLMHALLLLVDRATPSTGTNSLVKTTLGVIAVPAFWYLGLRVIFPLMQGKIDWQLYNHVQEVTFVVLTVAFMFLLMRLTYLLILKMPPSKLQNVWLIKVPLTIVLPLLCFLVYNGKVQALGGGMLAEVQLIGDWSHPVYYLLVLINGLLLTFPPARRESLRLITFAAKGVLYPFVLYFFIVFLPFFPVAVGTVVVFGFGFLLLAPLILFFFNTWSLYEDGRVLGDRFGRTVPLLVFLMAFSIVPAGMTLVYSMDRNTLNAMLAHVYEPDYSSERVLALNSGSIRRVLNNIKAVKEGADFASGDRKPYLTTYYQWLVLDNLTLSNSRLGDLERIFLDGPAPEEKNSRAIASEAKTPSITKVVTKTELSSDGSHYVSQVDLTITNDDGEREEFATRFGLPAGAWIQNYYLVINGEKVEGILAEKKSALWLYQQIRDVRRDPGILYYTSPDELILRVFPFSAHESRQTGFEIIHREPVSLQIDNQRIELQAHQPLAAAPRHDDGNDNFVVVSPDEKAALPKYRRKPYLHFIIDRSSKAAAQFEAYRKRIDDAVKAGKLQEVTLAGAKVTVAHYADQTFSLDKEWQIKAQNFASGGGFFVERAVKKVLYGNYRQHAESYPLFVVITDHPEQAVYTEGMRDFAITMPEGDLYYVMDGEKGMSARRFGSPTEEVSGKESLRVTPHVLAWPDASEPVAFLPDDGRSSLVIKDIAQDYSTVRLEGSSWQNGVTLYGMWLSSKLDPHGAGRKHYSVITNSFGTHLLTPLTAFLSLENETQRQVLIAKQQQMLASMRPLDAGEEHEMDEPPLWVLALLLMALFIYKWLAERPSDSSFRKQLTGREVD